MYFDCHTHTKYSCDASKEPRDAIISAIDKGLCGIAFTDHSDLRLFEAHDIPKNIPLSCKTADELNREYMGKIRVFSGIEISDAAIEKYNDRLNAAFSFYNYDILLASSHIVDYKGKECEFSSADFSGTDTYDIDGLLRTYFEYMLKTVYDNKFDVLCHVTYPLRYINGIYKKGATLDGYIKTIEDVFKVIIDKGTALEINTAKCTEQNPRAFCPEEDLLELYISLGGKMFTLGSDSHMAGSEGRGFDEAADFLLNHGICGCYYFEKRQPHFYNIKKEET